MSFKDGGRVLILWLAESDLYFSLGKQPSEQSGWRGLPWPKSSTPTCFSCPQRLGEARGYLDAPMGQLR